MTEFQRLRRLEENGAAAAATLLRRHCRELVDSDLKLLHSDQLITSSSSHSKFEIGNRTTELLVVLSKMTHEMDLLVSTAPIVFEAIQASLDSGTEGLTASDITSICVIMGKFVVLCLFFFYFFFPFPPPPFSHTPSVLCINFFFFFFYPLKPLFRMKVMHIILDQILSEWVPLQKQEHH